MAILVMFYKQSGELFGSHKNPKEPLNTKRGAANMPGHSTRFAGAFLCDFRLAAHSDTRA